MCIEPCVLSSMLYEPVNGDSLSDGIHLWSRHVQRIQAAFSAFGQARPSQPGSAWRTDRAPTAEKLASTVSEVIACSGSDRLQRLRLTVDSRGHIDVRSTRPASPPNDELCLALDRQATVYDGDITLSHKTTSRKVYDDARIRCGATLEPRTDAPFDVVMYNDRNEVTETTISNIAFRRSADDQVWVTPSASCGLLPGVQRQELLDTGFSRDDLLQCCPQGLSCEDARSILEIETCSEWIELTVLASRNQIIAFETGARHQSRNG
ncbi:uncharacterized protein L969DRAFT_96979 [Mixia osmundae IAM 14324]|uniref:Uncharacterized protein n=1 Tax=Mixia osmundae (strain CBS 9802 / IAM 14324 / JCM 22182 / KY 12970) TaxID=764103 RepID=G7E2P0_MIXOS|nr:uncharacterized protein L969DRAFT_96979 [Mixia osmundae IAM 14324]KEI36965.1 hypothetical protein L969DRAFT_96979 [Mixia osmundae IAM 14324]GAA97100.1 hypothetical protein E5Q_03775 [Mixia osmundae IAM 14324]